MSCVVSKLVDIVFFAQKLLFFIVIIPLHIEAFLAEGEGFEPSKPFDRFIRFPSAPLQPLEHPSNN